MNQPNIPTYQPGTVLTVGSHHVRVIKYLTSGGFAQIYAVEISPPDSLYGSNFACLKRVIVPDKASLNVLRAEVDAMKLLKNNKNVVSYIDSNAAKSTTQIGSYEVFLLMEYCENGGLIDFMNSRLQVRLREDEVLKIMSHVSQGVAAMHALQPPLIHRDIKIENVLISRENDYKLCDFGSVCGIIRPPNNPQEFSYVQHDIMKNTTAQYRSPEMIDLYRGVPIDEKSDIWALGVFLYKLCYYTTPFENNGETAILSSKFEFPAYPPYSNRLKNLISSTFRQRPVERPNIYDVVKEVSNMQNVPCPIINFYLQHSNVPSMNNLTNRMMNSNNASTVTLQPQQINIPVQHQINSMGQHPQYMLTGNGTGPSIPTANNLHSLPHLIKTRSTTALNNSTPHKKYHEHPLTKNPDLFPTAKLIKTRSPLILSYMELSSSSDEEQDNENEESNTLQKLNRSTTEDKIMDSINRQPTEGKNIGGRKSVSIAKLKNKARSITNDDSDDEYEETKNPFSLDKYQSGKYEDPIERKMNDLEAEKETRRVREGEGEIKNMQRELKDEKKIQMENDIEKKQTQSEKEKEMQRNRDMEKKKKELSKEEVNRRMLERLNAVENKFTTKSKHEQKNSSKETRSRSIQVKKKNKPEIPNKPDYLRPQKPKKPAFLVGKKINEVAGSTITK